MEELVTMFSTVGFPVAISIYLLVRLETKMSQLNDSINELTLIIEKSFIK